MAGELNGTKVLIAKDGGVIVGQMEATVTFNGSPIEIGSKSTGDWVTLLDGELSAKQMQLSGTIVYNSDTVYKQVRADALAGTQDTYTVTYDGAETTDEVFSATFVPNGLSDALPMGDKVTTSITFLSSGTVTHTPAVA